MDLPSRLDLYDVGRRYILQRAERITPEVVDTDGTDANLFVGSTSAVATSIVAQLRTGMSEQFYGSVRDEQADRIVLERTDGELPRKGASPARALVRIFRKTAAAGDGTVPIGTIAGTLNGFEYITLDAASFASGALAIDGIRVRATVAGKEPQVGRFMIRRFVKPELLFDPSLEIVNDDAASGGEARETDSLYLSRARTFSRARIRGTKRAIETGALTVAGVVSARAREALDGEARPARIVSLDLADSSGVSNLALDSDVQEALNDWRCCGIAVLSSPGLPQIVSVRLRLAFVAGASGGTANLAQLVRAAVVEFVNSLGAGQTLTRAALYAVLQRYEGQGLSVTDQTLVEPAGDIVPDPGRTLRTTLEQVQFV